MKEAPQRFYKSVAVAEEGSRFRILLDGKAARTRARNFIETESRALAEAVAAEWAGQGARVDLMSMPLTRLLTTTIDLGPTERGKWIDRISDFLKSDLVCYRADEAGELRDRQAAAWDVLLAAFETATGARLKKASGIVHVEQEAVEVTKATAALADAPDGAILAVRTLTEIAGSGVIGMLAWKSDIDPHTLFAASRLDEEFQIEKWGRDEEADARASALNEDFDAACLFLNLTQE